MPHQQRGAVSATVVGMSEARDKVDAMVAAYLNDFLRGVSPKRKR
jgi:hypothetical protein